MISEAAIQVKFLRRALVGHSSGGWDRRDRDCNLHQFHYRDRDRLLFPQSNRMNHRSTWFLSFPPLNQTTINHPDSIAPAADSKAFEIFIKVTPNSNNLTTQDKPFLRLVIIDSPEVPFLVRRIRKKNFTQDTFLQLRIIIFVKIIAHKISVSWRVLLIDMLDEVISSEQYNDSTRSVESQKERYL